MKTKRSATQALVAIQARREHSVKELRTKLAQRGYEPEAIDKALAFAAQHALQDDARFARSQGRMLASRKGDRALSLRLQSKGVAKDLVAATLADLPSEAARALDVLRRYDGQEPTPQLRQKVWQFLAGRGFSAQAIAKAWRAWVEGEDIEK